MLQSAFVRFFFINNKENVFVTPFSRSIRAFCFLSLVFAVTGYSQTDNKPAPTPTPTPVPVVKGQPKLSTADQVAEAVIGWYGFPTGRVQLNQIRKTTFERGKTKVTDPEGHIENATYQRFVIRGEALNKERIRLDQEFPSARYSLVYKDDQIFGIYNNTRFTPRQDASSAFESQIVHGLEALLRYKENDSKLELGEREKVMGVDYYVVTVTDKKDRKTRFYVSAKSYRVMMLTYEEGGIKYRRKFYDYNYAQGTLVPFRSVLYANDKIIEEVDVGTITFGQKVDEDLFNPS